MEAMPINKDQEVEDWEADAHNRSPDYEDRMGFIKKVYGILSVQLALTTGAIAATKAVPAWNETMKSPAMTGIGVGLLVVAMFISCAIICCKSVARKTPTNYILLFVFTACEAFAFSTICAHYQTSDCLTAAGMTTLVTAALTFYACTTKSDFTVCGSMFFILGMVMICLCLASIFMTFASWWHPLVSGIIVVFYGLYLVYDTQLICGGKKYELSYDDYIIGALILYVDIMMLFLELLKIFGRD